MQIDLSFLQRRLSLGLWFKQMSKLFCGWCMFRPYYLQSGGPGLSLTKLLLKGPHKATWDLALKGW